MHFGELRMPFVEFVWKKAGFDTITRVIKSEIHMRTYLLPLVAFAMSPTVVNAGGAAPTAPEIRGPAELDRLTLMGEISAILEKHSVPGAHVTLTMGPDIVLSRAFGSDPSESDAAFDSDTPARLASATKFFTALTMLSLIEGGELSLDETLGEVDPSLPAHWHDIPVWRVLNHTSGIPMIVTREDFNSMEPEEQLAIRPTDLLDMIGAAPLDFAPGEGWHYQQGAFALLARALEKRTGRGWLELVDDHVLAPAGLTHTRFGRPENQADAYTMEDGQAVRHGFAYPETFAAAGGIDTSGRDIGRLFTALAGGKILTEESLRHIGLDSARVHRLDGDADGEGYGLSMTVQRFGDVTFLGHSGGGGLADIRYAPERQMGIAVLTNRSGGTGAAIEIANLITEKLVGPAHESEDG